MGKIAEKKAKREKRRKKWEAEAAKEKKYKKQKMIDASKGGKEQWWKLKITMCEQHLSKSEKKAENFVLKLKKTTKTNTQDWDEAALYKEKTSKIKKQCAKEKLGAKKETADKAEKKAKARAHERAEKADEKKR